MPLISGTRLGVYEVMSLLGSGGMGEVYRARDTRLNRDVAIKVLPDLFANDVERLARFMREAQTLASLNHANIAAIYGIEESGPSTGSGQAAMHALVMELVEGEDLSQRIAQGPIPLDEALAVATQIAEALAAAHEQGIIHRDLKPANVKVRSDGTVKVLDFGLAKAVEASASTSVMAGAILTQSPTLTSPMTAVGSILGTAAYMAPEQARGRAVDRRADIWAFGCVFYEMLTGARPFKGEDISDVLVSILRDEPDWTRLPVDTPPYIHALLRRCLKKDVQKRLPHLGIVRLELTDGASEPTATTEPHNGRVRRRIVVGALSALVAVLVTAIVLVARPDGAKADTVPLLRFQLQPPPGEAFPGANGVPRFAISPDGSRVVFGSARAGVRDQLWIRRLDSVEAVPLKGTESEPQGGLAAQQPFWSPDSRFIGFFDEQTHKLKTLNTEGGLIQTVCDLSGNQYSGSWNRDRTILFSTTDTKGIQRISASDDARRGASRDVSPVASIPARWKPFCIFGCHFRHRGFGDLHRFDRFARSDASGGIGRDGTICAAESIAVSAR
jgi:eukaryotic-like serine/threonine-protein kinase